MEPKLSDFKIGERIKIIGPYTLKKGKKATIVDIDEREPIFPIGVKVSGKFNDIIYYYGLDEIEKISSIEEDKEFLGLFE